MLQILQPLVMRRTQKLIFIVVAVVVSSVAAFAVGGGVYLFAVKQYRYTTVRPLFRFAFVRGYLFDAKFRRLLELVAARDADSADTFSIASDASNSELLSKRVFQPVEMDGVLRYMYRPGATVLQVAGANGMYRDMVLEDTPAVREALAELDVRSRILASYDEHGFRRADADLARDCRLHVLFVGDSFTDGVGVSDPETFVNRFGHRVRERAGLAVCPVNSGVEGFGSQEEAWVLEHRFEAAGRPGVVLVMFYANDVDTDIDALLDGALPDADEKWSRTLASLARMSAFCAREHATMVLAAIPVKTQMAKPDTRRHYQEVLQLWAAGRGIAFIDLLDGFLRSTRDRLYAEDEHFAIAGHDLAAEILDTRTAGWLAARRDVVALAGGDR